ncbi:unnamed protein product [Adineta steineri]|uniref:RING-type domain-containing protein n=1 Tax=Adineta steineri TaxID=433720 RepID=A0A819IYU9_9BILA|nr:unnamed protein product [Adineta steineri]CAF1429855.1 unnamed protein product [Adineta steineri]CAF3758450.1 unnamed protein product [Adineta steineri]CAF3921919.1 unnamed protein product [Adineta steineri]
MSTTSATNNTLPQLSSISNDESADVLENGTGLSNHSRTRSRNENIGVTWIDLFLKCDQKFSGSLLHICYRIIDVILLCTGLSSGYATCHISNNLTSTSLCLLIFYFIDFLIIITNLCRCTMPSHHQLTEEEKSERFRRVTALRGFFLFFKLIPAFFGAGYVLTVKIPLDNECQLMRFCLGVVCISTILVIIMPPTKPVMPQRRSFIMECFILSFILIVNGAYFLSTALSMKNVQQSSCIYQTRKDLYLGAPLKSYAYIGLLLFSCTTTIHIISMLISQICNRLRNGRRLYTYYYALQYTLNYFGALMVIYYLAVGALFLLRPRSGQPCREDAPGLFRTLLVWEWIRVLSPLVAVPLVLILCCLGVFFGFILSYCLPASVTVPLLEVIRNWLSAAPVNINREPPATRATLSALPVVQFGQEPDQFNQTECAICRANFEADEPLKKLECAHLFHSECVDTWLSVTGICPICRHRMSSIH